jgi:hypothetical protein
LEGEVQRAADHAHRDLRGCTAWQRTRAIHHGTGDSTALDGIDEALQTDELVAESIRIDELAVLRPLRVKRHGGLWGRGERDD